MEFVFYTDTGIFRLKAIYVHRERQDLPCMLLCERVEIYPQVPFNQEHRAPLNSVGLFCGEFAIVKPDDIVGVALDLVLPGSERRLCQATSVYLSARLNGLNKRCRYRNKIKFRRSIYIRIRIKSERFLGGTLHG